VEELTDYEQLVLDDPIGDPNTGSTSGSAMYAKGRKDSGKKDGKKDKYCTHYKMNNHNTEVCRRRQQTSRKHALSNSVICFQCGESGHVKLDCPLKKRVDERLRRQRSARALVANEERASEPANRLLENTNSEDAH